MAYFFVGLGNVGEKYELTRHNSGRMVLEYLHSKRRFSPWEENGHLRALVSKGHIGKEEIVLLLPQTMMNKSGMALKPLITSIKKAHRLAVLYDDLDLPLGHFKISFKRGSGGHKGVESIVRNIKTKEFVRFRIGISAAVRGRSRVKKPQGEKNVIDFILGSYSKRELDVIHHVAKDINEALEVFVKEGRASVMNDYN
ncbi:aminoacyl-tRNA hydrolase [Patescibacteria group bacterium]|nr:aminoacyl-tRNA hydrolase [Patescibacteria group bacterium]